MRNKSHSADLILYDYYRSSACFRVRIALNYKELVYETIPIHLLNDGGEQNKKDYRSINPQSLVPTLVHGKLKITQSLAIIDYLENLFPSKSLYPSNAADRAFVLSLACLVACDIHPVNNLRVLQYLQHTYDIDERKKLSWYFHWLKLGFDAIEAHLKLRRQRGPYSLGSELSIADICLIPQVLNAKRYGFDLSPYPHIVAIDEHCKDLEAVKKAHPETIEKNKT